MLDGELEAAGYSLAVQGYALGERLDAVPDVAGEVGAIRHADTAKVTLDEFWILVVMAEV